MAIPSSISIPNLYVQDPFSSALQQGLGSFQKSMQMKQQQDQFNKQQGLREQLAQMQMQQEQAKANLALTQAKTEGMPGQQMQAQQKAQMDMMYKQRTQDNKLIELATNNPDMLNNPQVMAQFNAATQRVSQDLPIPGQMQQPQGGMQQQGLQGSLQAMQGAQPGAMQAQQQGQPQQDVAEQMQFRQEQKMIPAETKNMMMRSTSAKLMMDDVEQDLKQLEPFFGKTNSLKGAVRAFAADKGLSDDKEGRLYNTLSSKIKALGGEVAAGMSKSRSEATIKEWQDISNPITSGTVSFDQVMSNLNGLRDIHSLNHSTLFANYPISAKHDEDFYNKRSGQIKSKYPQAEAKKAPEMQYTPDQIQAELKRRGL
jgi:hypothetical protein